MDRQDVSRRGFMAAVGAAAAGLAGCSIRTPQEADPGPDGSDGELGPATPVALDGASDAKQLTDGSAFTEVYREAVDSVVAVRVESGGGSAQGTAWVYHDDYLVTNEHVVSDADDIAAWFADVGWREGRVVGTDVYSDLAVFEVASRPADASALPLVESPPPVGAHVAAIGNPFGLSGSLTSGIISGRGRALPAPNGFSIPAAIQTDAAVNPGNSGGPLVTLDGNVAGVINSGGGDNIGFAISAAMVERVAPALIEDGSYEHSYMGVEIQDVTLPLARANGLEDARGVYVHEVVDGTPSAGVLQGSTGQRFVDGQTVDVGGDVVRSLAGQPIPNREALSRVLALYASPGDTVDVGVIRDGSRQTVRLTLGARPSP